MDHHNTGYKFGKTVLLLGAGFTKNFGGLLADEMWAEIFNHNKVQVQPRIKKLMLNNFDYEEIYYSVLECLEDKEGLFPSIEFKIEEKEAIKEATKFAYKCIDEILIRHIIDPLPPYPFFLSNVNDLISTFKFQRLDYKLRLKEETYNIISKEDKNFIFTLNQDLFFERLYRNNDFCQLSIPGIENDSDWFTYKFNKPLESKDYRKLPTEDKLKFTKDDLFERGEFFLIKLHGSYNWISSNGSDMMVIGRGKIKQIKSEPLLDYYFDIFNTVLSQGQCCLIVIGYGFGDEHINSVISHAVENNGLRIYVLSPESPKKLKEKLCARCNAVEGTNIWNGISGYFQHVNEILLGSLSSNKVAKEQFLNVLFDKKN
jgi:hypothetical protein